MRDEAGQFRNPPTLKSPSHVLWQTLVLLAIWLYMCSLHTDNNGLWFQGDAPRHAINGFFWIDYLRDFTWEAKSYALAYYARYPAIDPAARPPVFYLLAGAGYQLLGPSPFVAKGLVLCFSLMAALYLLAWLREWISAEAGWTAALFLLLPGIVTWSHAIMPNVPSLAIGLAALYHARCWLELPGKRRRDFVLATILTLLGILTYYQTGVVVLIIATWIAMRGDWKRWTERRTLLAVGGCILVLLPFVWLISHWAPVQVAWLLPTASTVGKLTTWTYYPTRILRIFNVPLLCLAGVGALAGLAKPRWRRETAILTSWVAVLYAVFTLLFVKDMRYALPAVIPLLGLSAIAVLSLCGWAISRFRFRAADARWLSTAVILAILVCQAVSAAQSRVPAVRGYRELVSFLEQVAPREPVFYDGYYDSVFTFYVRAGDPQFQRRAVVGNKLLYAYAITPGWRQQNFVGSPEEVIELLQQRGGCRWLAIEISPRDLGLPPMRHLREAVKTPAFELVRSFPIDAPAVDRVDVYKFQLPVANVQEVELPFPKLGPEVKYHVRPIPTRDSG